MQLLSLSQQWGLPFQNPVLIFSLILFIILFAPIILNRFKIPHLIGLIIAGALIGPNGFYLMARDSSIELFGQVGLLYIMFLAGLEIDLGEFKKNKWRSLLFGMYTFTIPMALGIGAGLYLLRFPLNTSILLASMFASHTLITYPIVSKMGIAKNRAVNVTVGGTLITDTLALLVLAVIVGMTKGEINQDFWIRISASIIIFSLIIIFIFPIVARWFFKNYDDNISQYIFVLGLVFVGAFLAELAGIEAIIGAFLAGLALNRLIPSTSPLMNRIEFVGNALFIPFFLIVGVSNCVIVLYVSISCVGTCWYNPKCNQPFVLRCCCESGINVICKFLFINNDVIGGSYYDISIGVYGCNFIVGVGYARGGISHSRFK
jgi:Kef-type K+ transport system membrane component KefB